MICVFNNLSSKLSYAARSRSNYIFILLLISVFGCSSTDDSLNVTSPDNNISLSLVLENDSLYYQINRDGENIIKNSKLGFEFNELPSLDHGFEVLNVEKRSFNENWEQPWGEKKTILNHYNELYVELSEKEGLKRKLNLIFRLFNDGVGFRYVFPEQDGLKEFEIMNELTQFNFADDFTSWWVKAYQSDRYEYLYNKSLLSQIADTVHTPLTMVSDKGYSVSLHEANLTDYSSMTLYRSDSTTLNCDLVPWASGVKVKAKAPFETPWRTIQIADKATDLISSHIILNLNEPNKLGDVSWAEPAKYMGVWWEMHLNKSTWSQGPKHGANTENVKKYMDFAAENGFKGVLVEGWNEGWDGNWWQNGDVFNFTKTYPDFDIEAISAHGQSKGVGLIGHHETGAGVKNYESQLEDALDFYQKHGVKYIKTGYVNANGMDNKEWHHGQYGVRHYRKVVEEAAKRNIVICAHEPIKATGIRRTFPNMMTREGARGQEFNAWGPKGGNPPNHETILPFTRLLAGPMDFTPGIFDITLPSRENNQVNTTLAKQLALYVVIYSPLQMAADLPENYEGQPAFQFIKDVAVDWEDTQVINGEVGEYVTIVRKDRNSANWFLGSMTNEKERDFEIDLSFLEKGAKYKAIIYADAKNAHYKSNPTEIVIETKELSADSTLNISLAAGGGQAISFMKMD